MDLPWKCMHGLYMGAKEYVFIAMANSWMGTWQVPSMEEEWFRPVPCKATHTWSMHGPSVETHAWFIHAG